MSERPDDILHLRNVDLLFSDFYALRDVSLRFARGKIHGIFGRNGAGKSMLIELLAGVRPPSGGQILFNGSDVHFASPQDALRAGIGSVLQADTYANSASVAENMMMHEYAMADRRRPLLSGLRQRRDCQALLDRLRIAVDCTQPMHTLNYGTKQLVKLARVLYSLHRFQLLVMDELCISNSQEEARFYALLETLRARGYTVLFTTHQIETALPHCDTVTVLDNARVSMHCPAAEADYRSVLRALSSGSAPQLPYPTIRPSYGRTMLEVSHVSTKRIDNVSFSLKKGEILGVAGLLGSGRTGIARAIAGLDPLFSGTIRLDNERLPAARHARLEQIGFLPSNRGDCLELDFPISVNITMSNLALVQSGGLLDARKEQQIGYHYVRNLNIKAPCQDADVRYLSAGNQKKALLSRLLFHGYKLLILDEPTAHIDVLSKNEIYNQINAFALQGNAVILISSDVEELSHLCTRILLMRDRTVAKELSAAKLQYENLLGPAAREE